MHSYAILIAIVGVSVSGAADAAAPVKKRPVVRAKARPAPKPDPIDSLIRAVMINSVREGENLYEACRRSSFKALAWAMYGAADRISTEKSEYETQAEFAQRRAKTEDALAGLGDIVVCQSLYDNEDAPFAYDAENGGFKGSFSNHQNVWRDVKPTGSYVSRTRMGIRATIKSSLDIEYDVDVSAAFDKLQSDCIKAQYGTMSYWVPVGRAQAPAIKASSYLVFKGRLVSPFVRSSDSPGSPTLDDPYDVYERTITVAFKPSLVAIAGSGGTKPFECRLS